MVDHIDGNESNGTKRNLRWLCRSCNTLLGAEMARTGEGRRTVQYNPGGAKTLWEYTQAVLQHTRKAHDAAGRIIHETPKWKRREYASQIWDARHGRGTASPGSASAGHDEPDWVTNPATSGSQYRLAQAVLSGTARETHMSREAAREIVDRTPAKLRSEFSRNPSDYAVYKTHPYLQHLRTFATKGEAHRFASSQPGGMREHQVQSVERKYSSLRNPSDTPTEYHLGYSLGQADRQSAQLRKTLDELHATFAANFGPGALASWESFEQAYQAGYGGQMGAAAPNPGKVTLSTVQSKIDRLVDEINLKGHSLDRARRLRELKEQRDQLEGLEPLNPYAAGDAWTTIYKTRAAAQSAWYDSAPGRNDRATYKKVRGGWVIVPGANNPSDFEAGAEAAAMYTRINVRPDRKSFLNTFNQWKRAHGKSASLAEFTAGFKSAAPERWTRNPEPEPQGDGSEEYQQALRTAELFHGRPVKEEIAVTEAIRTHDWYVSIGPLIKLIIKPVTKKPKARVPLPFHQSESGQVQLFCSPDGKQFYLRGGDQELDLEAFGMGERSAWYRDHMLIGEAVEITYRDKKKFHSFKLTDYYHKLGEETRIKPTLAYDSLAKKLEIIGGQYRIEMEDLVDGMSPGIVN
jgi:hypothetical protein